MGATRIARGVSLLEALVATTLMGLSALAIGQAVTVGQLNARDARERFYSTISGEELIERILALPYDDPNGVSNPGPESGEVAPGGFDNIDDYHGYSELAGATSNAAGLSVPDEWDLFHRSVSVSYISLTVNGLSEPVEGLNITLTMSDQHGQTWTLGRFVAEP